jgi:hypothetical protein
MGPAAFAMTVTLTAAAATEMGPIQECFSSARDICLSRLMAIWIIVSSLSFLQNSLIHRSNSNVLQAGTGADGVERERLRSCFAVANLQ